MTTLRRGQVAVVTGGASGIGLALARSFVRRGLRVALADVDRAALDASVAQLQQSGGTVIGVPTDVADRQAVRALRELVLAAFGSVDVICNNAGVYNTLEPVWSIDYARWRRLFEINYWGVVHGVQEFVPLLVAQGSGHVLNTASMSGLSTVPSQADYGTAKHAVVALSEYLRADLALAGATGVGVTLLCPAVVRTPMGERALALFNSTASVGDRGTIGSGPDLASVLDPDGVAEAAVEGIERDRLYVTPTPGSRERFSKRVQPIFDAFDRP